MLKIKTFLVLWACLSGLSCTGFDDFGSSGGYDDSWTYRVWACPAITPLEHPFLTDVSNVTLIDPFNGVNLADGFIDYYARGIGYDSYFGNGYPDGEAFAQYEITEFFLFSLANGDTVEITYVNEDVTAGSVEVSVTFHDDLSAESATDFTAGINSLKPADGDAWADNLDFLPDDLWYGGYDYFTATLTATPTDNDVYQVSVDMTEYLADATLTFDAAYDVSGVITYAFRDVEMWREPTNGGDDLGYFIYENDELIAETDETYDYETYCVPTIDVENTTIIDQNVSE